MDRGKLNEAMGVTDEQLDELAEPFEKRHNGVSAAEATETIIMVTNAYDPFVTTPLASSITEIRFQQ